MGSQAHPLRKQYLVSALGRTLQEAPGLTWPPSAQFFEVMRPREVFPLGSPGRRGESKAPLPLCSGSWEMAAPKTPQEYTLCSRRCGDPRSERLPCERKTGACVPLGWGTRKGGLSSSPCHICIGVGWGFWISWDNGLKPLVECSPAVTSHPEPRLKSVIPWTTVWGDVSEWEAAGF